MTMKGTTMNVPQAIFEHASTDGASAATTQ